MANIKNLKKDINHVLGDILQECYIYQLVNAPEGFEKTGAIEDEIVELFDALIAKVHAPAENKKQHFNAIKAELETGAKALLEKVNAL